MASHTKRDGQIPSRFVYIHTLLPSPYRTSRRIYNFCTKVLAVIAIMVIFDLSKNARSESYYPCYSESGVSEHAAHAGVIACTLQSYCKRSAVTLQTTLQ